MSKVKIDKEALKEALKPVYYSIKYVNSSKACLHKGNGKIYFDTFCSFNKKAKIGDIITSEAFTTYRLQNKCLSLW